MSTRALVETNTAVPDHGCNWPDPDLIDGRHALLAQAGALDVLVARGEIALDDASEEIVPGFLEVVFPRPKNPAEAYWDAPSWHEAAIWYRKERGLKPSLVSFTPAALKFYHRLLDDDVTIDRAMREIEKRRQGQ